MPEHKAKPSEFSLKFRGSNQKVVLSCKIPTVVGTIRLYFKILTRIGEPYRVWLPSALPLLFSSLPVVPNPAQPAFSPDENHKS